MGFFVSHISPAGNCFPVGVSLLANALGHSMLMLAGKPLSRAGCSHGGWWGLQWGGLDDFDPVGIRVFDERQALHAAVVQAFLEVAAQRFEAFARGDDVGH